MSHPVIEEFTRIFSLDRLQVTSFRRMQRILRDEVQPMLDERERLLVENADLRQQLELMSMKLAMAGPVVVPGDDKATRKAKAGA
jgi:regulator of replication initiation timing